MFWRKKEKRVYNDQISAGIGLALDGLESMFVFAGFAILTLLILLVGATGTAIYFGLKYFGVM